MQAGHEYFLMHQACDLQITCRLHAFSADFFTELRNWLKCDVDNFMGAATFESLTVGYVIKPPAIWSDLAKSLTRWCAERAGMGQNVRIITEPETAMIDVVQ